MRTISAVLKAACQTGQGLFITSAVVTPLTVDPHDNQTYDVLEYKKDGENLTALLRGDAIPYWGSIVISRGYQVAGTEYTEPLPPFILTSVIEIEGGDFQITAKTGAALAWSAPSDVITGSYLIKTALENLFSSFGIAITCPEHVPEPFSITNLYVDVGEIQYGSPIAYSSDLLKEVLLYPYAHLYQTEDGLKVITDTPDSVTVASISIVRSSRIMIYDWPFIHYDDFYSAYAADLTASPDRQSDYVKVIKVWPLINVVPDFETALNKYYNERDNAKRMFLLADVSLEDADVFEYSEYYWRIESIDETFKNGFTQSLFCLRVRAVPGNLLTEAGEFLITEAGLYLTGE